MTSFSKAARTLAHHCVLEWKNDTALQSKYPTAGDYYIFKKAQADWNSIPALKSEFSTFETYYSYTKAITDGRGRVIADNEDLHE